MTSYQSTMISSWQIHLKTVSSLFDLDNCWVSDHQMPLENPETASIVACEEDLELLESHACTFSKIALERIHSIITCFKSAKLKTKHGRILAFF